MAHQEAYLVMGGSGFLGRKIVEALLRRGEKNVSTFDIAQRYHDVPHYTGDITDGDQLGAILSKARPTVIFHTISPVHNLPAEIYYKVNVVGTLTLVKAAMANKIPCLVFTSSSGVVDAGINLIDADERTPYPDVFVDAYNESKALAEKIVLEANGRNGLLTVALRPAGIFGPGDRQVTPGYARVVERKQTGFQIGSNNNIFDMTYVDNVVLAHILAGDRLSECSNQTPAEWAQSAEDRFSSYVGYTDATIGERRIPSSEAKPLGPISDRPITEEEKLAEKNFRSEEYCPVRPVTRTKFDPLSDPAADLEKVIVNEKASSTPAVTVKVSNGQLEAMNSPFLPESVTYTSSGTSLPHPSSVLTPNLLQVPGQVFFITNGEPVYFWDFSRAMWKELGDTTTKRFVLPTSIGYAVGAAAEWFAWALGKEAGFTRFRIAVTSNSRWFNIEKARRVLGYEPQIGIEEGLKLTGKWFHEQGGLASLQSH